MLYCYYNVIVDNCWVAAQLGKTGLDQCMNTSGTSTHNVTLQYSAGAIAMACCRWKQIHLFCNHDHKPWIGKKSNRQSNYTMDYPTLVMIYTLIYTSFTQYYAMWGYTHGKILFWPKNASSMRADADFVTWSLWVPEEGTTHIHTIRCVIMWHEHIQCCARSRYLLLLHLLIDNIALNALKIRFDFDTFCVATNRRQNSMDIS